MTPRPGRVVLSLRIELPRPRTLEMEFSQEFKTYTNAIRDAVYSSKRMAAA
jgi:NitT/TauT family transport system ATP-binding protein